MTYDADAARDDLRRVRAHHAARVEAATAHLRTVNLAEFRDTMRAVFASHPVLETVRFEQVAMYNDEYNALGQSDLWVNGRHVHAGTLYDVGPNRHMRSQDRVVEFVVGDDPAAAAIYRRWYKARWPVGDTTDPEVLAREAARAADALRAHFGPLYVAAEAVVECMLGLYARYGPHFFWDAFGSRATVEVDREAIRISDAVENADAYLWSDLYSDQARAMLGPFKDAYLDSPERQGQAALREVALAETRRAEHRWMWTHLGDASRRVRETLGVTPWRYVDAARQWDAPVAFVWGPIGVSSIQIAGLDLPAHAVRADTGWTYACVPEAEPSKPAGDSLGRAVQAAATAFRPQPTADDCDAALAGRHGEAVRRAARLWLGAIREAFDEVGREGLDRFLPDQPEGRLLTF